MSQQEHTNTDTNMNAVQICPSCNASLSKGERFCGQCGHSLLTQSDMHPTSVPARKHLTWRSVLYPLIILVLATALGLETFGILPHLSSPPPPKESTVSATPSPTRSTPISHTPPSLKWAFQTGNYVESSPTVVNGVLYVGSADNKLYALDTSTGLQKWAFSTGDSVFSSPTVVNGMLYIGSNDGKEYALDANTGLQKWAVTTGAAMLSSATVVNGVLYVGSGNDGKKVYALDADTGLQKWIFSTSPGAIYSSPTVVNGVLYIGSGDGYVYALDASTGQKKWASPFSGSVYSPPSVVNGVVYVSTVNHHKVYALDAGGRTP